MSDVELDKQRDAVIEEIKQAFPVKVPPKAIVKDRSEYHNKVFLELFEGKSWTDLINHPDIVYVMSDVDFVRSIKESTFTYYLPAFLISSLNEPDRSIWSYGLTEIWKMASKFNSDKLQALISYFTYQEKFYRSRHRNDYQIKLFEDLALSFMVLLDEKKPKA